MTRAELKAMAKIQIKGKIGNLFAITIIVGLISGALSLIPGAGSAAAAFLLNPAVSIGMAMIYLKLARYPNYFPKITDVFEGFKVLIPALKVIVLSSIYTFLWSLLFIIPGIIKAISYSQALFLVAENPDMDTNQALRQSEQMMMGHKLDYFILELSFIGWHVLGALTCGILYIWLEPYMQATMTNHYMYLRYGRPEQGYADPDFDQYGNGQNYENHQV